MRTKVGVTMRQAGSLLSQVLARYDTRVLMPPEPGGDFAAPASPDPNHPRAWSELQQWCLSEPDRFSVAALRGPGAAAMANLLCLERDGSLQMQATNGAGRLALRLKTKLRDLMPGRAVQADGAWDSGTLITTADGLAALSSFRPRRSTLMLIHGVTIEKTDKAVLPALLATIETAHTAHTKRMRLLLLDAAADQAWDSARTRCIATDAAAVRVSTPSFS